MTARPALGGRASDSWAFDTVSSLVRVYPDHVPSADPTTRATSVVTGETASFQVAFRPPLTREFRSTAPLSVEIRAPDAVTVTAYAVELVPCDLAAFPEHDDGYERDAPGLYPDLLKPLEGGAIRPLLGGWRSLWVDVVALDSSRAGSHPVEVLLRDETGREVHRTRWLVEVLPVTLPDNPLVISNWLHCDGPAQYYGVPVFSAAHWSAVEALVASAVRMGVTCALTPLWTPPLDTERGRRRLRTQLLEIRRPRDAYDYSFDFSRVDRWLEMCRRQGIRDLEMTHFFTQWGAEATPAIDVIVDGREVAEFGWHVRADDPAYRRFLEQLVPQLLAHLASRWDLSRVFFHISDEPSGVQGRESYARARAVVADLLGPCRTLDALSDVELWESGAVPLPVVATDAVEPFLSRDVGDFWVYHCVAQDHLVANRFFALPLSRLRVLGHQLFTFRCGGFLHWGFNFWNSELSRRPVDPFRDTTASGAFPGGDAFIVYPGPDGVPWESVRHRVFAQAMWDLRVMHRVAELVGRDAVRAVIDPDGSLRFDAFSLDPAHYLAAREALNRLLL